MVEVKVVFISVDAVPYNSQDAVSVAAVTATNGRYEVGRKEGSHGVNYTLGHGSWTHSDGS